MCSPALRHHLPAFLSLAAAFLGPPPPPRRLSEVAGSLRITEGPRGPRPESPKGDLLDPNEHHGWRAALRLCASMRYRTVCVIGCPQDGKDTTVSGPLIVWALNDLRRSVVYATTDRRLISALWQAKVEATMKASGYAHLFPADGEGSAGGTPGGILFTSGARLYLLGAGASNGGGQAGVSSWLVIITEADKLRSKQREHLEDRNKSYQDERLTLLIGTLDSGDKGQWATYHESTMGRMHHPCRHCAARTPLNPAWQPLEPDQVQFDATNADLARSTARIKCRAMGCLWDETDRKWSVARSVEVFAGQSVTGPADAPVITGDPIPAEIGGLRIWAMDSPFRSMPEYAATLRDKKDRLARTGDHEPLKAFTESENVMPYENKDEVLKLRESDLALRSSLAIHALKQSPDDGDICVVTVDQQLRRLIFTSLIFRIHDEAWWIVDHDSVSICGEVEQPTEAQFITAATTIEARVMSGYARPSGQIIKPMMGGIDTADGNTRERALKWMRQRPGWYAVRGQGGAHDASDALGEAVLRLPGVLTVYHQTKSVPHYQQIAIAVDIIKGEVMRALSRKPGSPGAGHLPKGEAAQGWLIRELCAEHQEMTPDGPVWIQDHRHNHRLDCTAYGLALAKYLAHLRIINPGNNNTATDYAAKVAKG